MEEKKKIQNNIKDTEQHKKHSTSKNNQKKDGKKTNSKVKELEKTLKEKEKLIQEKDKTIADLKKSLMWLRSDYENYKNSARKEMQSVVSRATEDLIKKMLAWIDNFERALNHLKEVDEDAYKGFSMIFKSMLNIFKDEGLTQINPKGEKFDVFEHEAIAREETDEVDEWTILDVVSNGYKLKGKLIKPAKVVVAVKPKEQQKGE